MKPVLKPRLPAVLAALIVAFVRVEPTKSAVCAPEPVKAMVPVLVMVPAIRVIEDVAPLRVRVWTPIAKVPVVKVRFPASDKGVARASVPETPIEPSCGVAFSVFPVPLSIKVPLAGVV